MFPSKNMVHKNLKDHPFFLKLSSYDIKARNAVSAEEYRDVYLKRLGEFTEKEKHKLIFLSKEADKKTLPFKKLHKIPWQFVKTGDGIENDFPHTMLNYIMLPFDFLYNKKTETLIETLVHEKIHVFQRKYTLETNVLITQFWRYDIYSLNDSIESKRANPDTNDIIYTRNNQECIQRYNTSEPTSLQDSFRRKECTYEHPYEAMAYILAEMIIRDIYTTDDHIQALKWMNIYMK